MRQNIFISETAKERGAGKRAKGGPSREMEIKTGEHTTIADVSISGTQPLKEVTWIKTDNPCGF